MVEYRKLKKENDDIEKYVALKGDDDRVRDSIEQINSITGRFYRLLQTVKKDGPMRSFFKAKEGYKFIVADYSQQEARIIAGLANDKKSIEIFKKRSGYLFGSRDEHHGQTCKRMPRYTGRWQKQ